MIDPITVSVLTPSLRVDRGPEMGEAMLRTAYSQILDSSRDFSTAICDRDARLVAQAEHVPIHVGAMPWAVESVRDFFAGRVKRGDVFLLNDPYHGGNHLPDLTAFVPVFVDGDSWPSGRSTARTRATSAAPPTAPTSRAPRKSGRRASASPRSSSTRPASCATTS